MSAQPTHDDHVLAVLHRAHRIPDYFHVNKSAFDNDWFGRVWLNPPYGNNALWFPRLTMFLDTGDVSQACVLSPLYAFTTKIARPLMERSSAMVLLSPTPEFWGNADNKTGTNHPHAIVYFGSRVDEFFTAFSSHGIPVELSWDRLGTAEAVAA